MALGVCIDEQKGFPDAITTVLPEAQVQTCIVHLIRNSLDFVSYKDRRAMIPFLAFPDDVRQIIYTKNAIKALNAKTAQSRQNPRPFPDRRERHQAALRGLELG